MSAFVSYDPSIIAKFAARLYAQAERIIAIYALLLGLGGLVVGGILGGAIGGHADAATYAWVGAVVVGMSLSIVGYLIGQERAFVLKLQAQTALCQLQIEINTRRAAA